MLNTWTVCTAIKDYYETNLAGVLSELSIADSFNVYQVGWKHPYELESYDAFLIVPDLQRPQTQEEVVILPIDVFVAVQASDIDKLNQLQIGCLDAVHELWRRDPSLGGAVFSSEIVEADYFDPRSGALLTGAAVVRLEAEIDTLGGY